MEHALAVYLVKQLNKIYPRTELENIKMAYGIEIVLDNLLKMVCIIIVAALTGLLRETLIVFIGFGVLRLSAGGRHMDRSSTCLLLSGLITIGGGFLARLHILARWECIIALLVSCIVASVYAPSGTVNNPIHEKYKKVLKVRSIVTIGIYVLVILVQKDSLIQNALTIGTVCEVITILPVVNRKYNTIT